MEIIKGLLKLVLLGTVGIWLLIEFMTWSEPDIIIIDDSIIAEYRQLLPYKLGYYAPKKKGDTEPTYKQAVSLYVNIYQFDENNELTLCAENMTNNEGYETLSNIMNSNDGKLTYVPVVVQHKKESGIDCRIKIDEWEKFKTTKQPSEQEAKEYNQKNAPAPAST